jgi:hypothetical protein
MADMTRARPWRVRGASVQGASHKRNGLPNQDSLLTWTPGASDGPPALIAVADGHGGSRHFRSAIGSAFAVEAARVALQTIVTLLADGNGASRVDQIDSIIRRLMVAEWRAMVGAHLAAHPCTDDELERLVTTDGEGGAAKVAYQPIIAYGSTVLACLLAHDTLVLVQLGDGDIVCVQSTGTVARGFERDERHVGSVTTSLCQPNAEDEVRVRVISLAGGDGPVLVCLSTDGYANSFRTDDDFLRIGGDVLSHIESRGLPALAGDLPAFLDEASTRGSGDDITIAILTCVSDPMPVVAEAPVVAPAPAIAAIDRGERQAVAADAVPAVSLREATPSMRRSPIAIGLGVFIILIAAAWLAASIPCARIPLMRPICEARAASNDEPTNADSPRTTAPKKGSDRTPAPKAKGDGKRAGDKSR